MKCPSIVALSLLLSCMISLETSCSDVAIPETSSSILSTIIYSPVNLASAVFSLLSKATNTVLQGGSKVIEGTGDGLSTVGTYITTTSQEHKVISGLLGLAALGAVAKYTTVGQMVTQRIYKALQTLLGLEEDEMKCACADHRTMASYLN